IRIDIFAIVVADDAGADDGARLLPERARGLAGPALHAIADIVLDVGGGHAAVEREHLHRRALERRENVDRDHGHGQPADDTDGQDHDHDRVPIAEREANQSIHAVISPLERSTLAWTT